MKPDRKKSKQTHEAHPPARSRADESEPAVAHAPVPVWIFVVLAVALFWGMLYLDNHAGGFNPQVYGHRFSSTNELAKAQPVDPAMKDYFAGMQVYNRPTCVACHQANGLGTPPTFPPLAGSEWVLENNPSRIIRIVLDGLTGPIQVKGQSYNSQMLGWRTTLKEEEIAQVITYVRKAWGNSAGPVTAEQVAKIKEETAAHAGQYWTAEELMQVPVP